MNKEKLSNAMKTIGLDDLYKTQDEREQSNLGELKYINIDSLDDFPNHPFSLHENSTSMQELMNSIKDNDIQNPLLVRRKGERYEIVSGHRRKYVARINDMDAIPCLVKELTDDQAAILMVDSNIHRDEVLPSEKAKAYKIRYDAMKHQGKATSRPLGEKLLSLTEMSKEVGESERQISRYIQLNDLIPEILDMVDQEKIKMRPGVEISRLSKEEQNNLYETMLSEDRTPSLSQAQLMKKESIAGGISMDRIFEIMTQKKANEQEKIIIKQSDINRFVPNSYTPRQVEELIVKLLEQWYRKRLRNRERER